MFDLNYEDFSFSNENKLLERKGYAPRFNKIDEAVFDKPVMRDEQKANITINDENTAYNLCAFDAKDMTLIDNATVWNGTPNLIVR